MLGTKQDSTVLYDHPSKTFVGVRFVLLGFDPINAQKVRSKLVTGGGVDLCQYGPHCSHVIVDKLIYDDPICAAARTDGKVLVTGLWVDHCFDIGMPVDPTSVMYRPLIDLDGIPGAKCLIVCLTGYQRQDRDDIMTLVGLMGATFSKPLVANKVTHLICYKYEGEKYELAKRMKKIKLANHRWLEDCLKAWEILPEADYAKSGYELEMMEAEAKDSEEEAQESPKKKYVESKINVSPHKLHNGTIRDHPSPRSKEEVSRNLVATSASKELSKPANISAVCANAEETPSVKASNLQDIDKKHPEVLCFQDPKTLGDVSCGDPSEQPFNSYDKTPTSAKGERELTSSESAKVSPHSDAAKLSSVSYSRKTPRRNTHSVLSGETSSNLNKNSEVDRDKPNFSFGFGFSSSREEHVDKTGSGFFETPSKKTVLCHEGGKSDLLPEKRKMEVSYGSSKSRKVKAHIVGSPLVINKTECSEPAILVNSAVDENATPGPGHKSPTDIVTTKLSSINRKYSSKSVVNTVTSDSRYEENLEALQTSFTGLDNMSLTSEPGVKASMTREENTIAEVGKQQKKRQDIRFPSLKTGRVDINKSVSPSLSLLKGDNSDSMSKTGRKKIARKSLGTRPRLGPVNTKNQKGSIYRNETALQSNVLTSVIGRKGTANKTIDNSEIVEMIPSIVNVERSGKEVDNKTGSMDDDETETPEDKEENEFEAKEKPREVDRSPTHKRCKVLKDKSENAQPITVKAGATSLSSPDLAKTSDEDGNGAELGKADHGRKVKPDKSPIREDSEKGKLTECKKSPLSKTRRKSVPSDKKRTEPNEVVNGEESKSRKNTKKTEKKKDKNIPAPTGKTKTTVPLSKLESSMTVEKENWPDGNGSQNASDQQVGKVASKSSITATEIDPKTCVANQDSATVEMILKFKVEPVWFILSGHKLQRKEFQQVIRCLKGRVCRDSHQWSYQATHFIVPDPIRRTEKFFAAAASGRWILKTDYLTASNQAGKFLAEEPYEWYKTGLSEDGAINLEAPRKWRLLRERTGHGAFYGMRIIIYGECIAPPLDTLKRVIRAGDGTILATSPPYTRYLESEVDFAIVSPGMPRVDIWVQEFLRYEIPCVLSDYLVEFVCKPGYSLERHVQYNSHACAERSFTNFVRRSEEVVIVEERRTTEDCVNSDLPCQICGSHDREEVMLICGDESGSTGCGVGMHIDCCNPPLERVPDEDWFCTKCSESRNSVSHPKSTKKRTSLPKGK